MPPINPNVRLGDLIDAEQASGLCEALTGLDAADVRGKRWRNGREMRRHATPPSPPNKCLGPAGGIIAPPQLFVLAVNIAGK